MPRETLRSQIDCVLSDIGADVVKTGMLPSAEVGNSTEPDPPQLPLKLLLEGGVATCPALTGHWALPPCSAAVNISSDYCGSPSLDALAAWPVFRSCGSHQVRMFRVSGVKETFLQVVEVVAEQCRTHQVSTLVMDPVLVSTSGHSLGDFGVAAALKERSAGFPDEYTLPCMPCACVFFPCVILYVTHACVLLPFVILLR